MGKRGFDGALRHSEREPARVYKISEFRHMQLGLVVGQMVVARSPILSALRVRPKQLGN
jgi:hypothetical protein